MVVALKKSDLYSSLWKGADELRGSMDASQYKDYVLTLRFVKYVSDKAKASKNSLIVVPKGSSFDDLLLLKHKPDIGERINVAIRALADENELIGVINNAERTHNERFVALMDKHLPDWRSRRDELNEAPLAAEEWARD